jgi:hypothetical protein
VVVVVDQGEGGLGVEASSFAKLDDIGAAGFWLGMMKPAACKEKRCSS